MAKSYFEKLKDPRWQKLRLEIMQRDGFACVNCGDKDSTLHVHHKFYRKGAAPWEYLDDALETLCEACHQNITDALEEIQESLGLLNHSQISNLAALIPSIRGILRESSKPDPCLTGWLIDIEACLEGLLTDQFSVEIQEQPQGR
jgi:hypothetical protein